eukprot:764568-Hanusia_phi.AAC.5
MASYQKAEADTSATRQIRSESGSVLVEEEEQETRFRKASFEEHRIVFDQLLSIICAYFLILGIRALVLQSPQTYGNLDIYHASCRLSAASACLLLKLMYRIPRLQEFLGTNRNKDNVLTLWIILLMQLELAQRAVGDLKRSRSPHHVSPHVKLEVEFKQGFPWRWSCTDSDPILSIWNHHSEVSHEDAGCVSRMVSADALAIYTVMGTLLSVSANVDGRAAVLISLGQGMSMIVACLMAGIKRESMIATVILHLVTSLCSAYLRNERFEASRNCFLRDYGLEASREKAHELMSSIIPKNLHARLKESNPLDLVGSNMEQCTIMFLSLAPDVLKDKKDITMEDFDLIDEIFSDFDAIVEFYGMFKYHHIQDSYVIACPRSACPFRVPSNRKSYQDLSMVRMIQLAHSLLERARMHRSTSGKQLWAKVGLSVGPATGAVVSCHRRFYCLFGDVINTSARMCAYSEPGQIHCTAEVVNILSNIKHDTIKIISRGELPIKGKGVMETFFLQINEEPYFEPEMITMCSSRRLSRRGDESDSVLRTSSMSSSSCSASVSSLRSSNSGQKAENTSKTSNIWREFLDEDECGGIFCVGYEVSQKWSSFLDRKVENEFLETNCLITFRCLVMGQTCNAVVSIITLHSLLQLDILKDERSIVQRKLVMMICLLHIFVQLHYLARCLTAYWRNVANQFRCCPAVKSVVLLDLHDVVIFTVQRDRSSAHLQLGLLLLQSPADLCQCKGLRHICCLQHRFLHSAHGLLLAANRLPHAPDSLCHGLRMRIVLEAGECPGANELDDHAGDQGAVSIHPQDLERPLPRGHRQGDSLHGQHLVEAPASCRAPPRPVQLH